MVGMSSAERPSEGAIIALEIDVQDTLRRTLAAATLPEDSATRPSMHSPGSQPYSLRSPPTSPSRSRNREDQTAQAMHALMELAGKSRVYVGYCYRVIKLCLCLCFLTLD
jgi:hypothetical protein